MVAPVGGYLSVIPLEFVIPHNVLIISSRFKSPG